MKYNDVEKLDFPSKPSKVRYLLKTFDCKSGMVDKRCLIVPNYVAQLNLTLYGVQ